MVEGMVSIVVPVYNAEPYLSEAITSISNQTYRNLEILLLDDGSTDKSFALCKGYRDDRIKAVHFPNRGVSVTRNEGMELAVGEFLVFIDADDLVAENMIEELIKLARETGADIVQCGAQKFYDNNQGKAYEKLLPGIEEDGFFDRTFFYRQYLNFHEGNSQLFSVWGKLFRTQFLKEKRLHFEPEMLVNEDSWFMLQAFHYNPVFYWTQKPYYYLRKHVTVSGSTRYWKRAFEDSRIQMDLIREDLLSADGEEDEGLFWTSYANKIVIAVVILCRRDKTYRLPALYRKLREIVTDKDVVKAFGVYKRSSRSHSLWIPVFIKYKLVLPLLLVASYRAGKRYGKLLSGKKEGKS